MNHIRKDNDLLRTVYGNIVKLRFSTESGATSTVEVTLSRLTNTRSVEIGSRFDELRYKHSRAQIRGDELGTCISCGYSTELAGFVVPVVNDSQECFDFVDGCPMCQANGDHIASVRLRYVKYLGRRETSLRLQSEGIRVRFPLPIEVAI